jgi:hypothetical protein
MLRAPILIIYFYRDAGCTPRGGGFILICVRPYFRSRPRCVPQTDARENFARTKIVPIIAAFASLAQVCPSLCAAELGPDEVLAPKWSVYCHPYVHGISTLELSWPVSRRPVAGALLAQRVNAQTLLVTAYRNGFDTGRFVSVTNVVSPTAAFALGIAPNDASVKPILPPLSRLRIVDVSTSQLPPRSGLRLQSRIWQLSQDAARTLGLVAPARLESVTVRLEGFDAGVRYTVRIQSGPEAVYQTPADISITAPSCPIDRADGDGGHGHD